MILWAHGAQCNRDSRREKRDSKILLDNVAGSMVSALPFSPRFSPGGNIRRGEALRGDETVDLSPGRSRKGAKGDRLDPPLTGPRRKAKQARQAGEKEKRRKGEKGKGPSRVARMLPKPISGP